MIASFSSDVNINSQTAFSATEVLILYNLYEYTDKKETNIKAIITSVMWETQ